MEDRSNDGPSSVRDVPVDWEALEDAFENNAPEVHSYLHVGSGEVLRVVDGIADPEMHARIAADANYLRVDPVSSREQYRWMERFIPMVEEPDLRERLNAAIDGKGAFRRFKDALMSHAGERERWFAFRSERLRVFMEAWLSAQSLSPVARVVRPQEAEEPQSEKAPAVSQDQLVGRRFKGAEALRRQLKEIGEKLGFRDLEKVIAFAEFVKARRVARAPSSRGDASASGAQETSLDDAQDVDEPSPSSRQRTAGT